MNTEDLKTYVKLNQRLKELDAQSDEVKDLKRQLEERLLEEFATDGIDSVKVDGQTVYLHRQLWAKVEEGHTPDDVAQGLKEAGLGHFVSERYNSQTISAWLRDLAREEEELPDELKGVLGSTEKFSIRVRRS